MTSAGRLRVGIVGAGLAGSTLAWRLRTVGEPEGMQTNGPMNGRLKEPVDVVLYHAPQRAVGDATARSGGMIRGFDRDRCVAADALAGLVELAADPQLAAEAGFVPAGSLVLLPAGRDPADGVQRVEEVFPGSAHVLDAGQVQTRWPVHGLPAGATAVWERHAGYLRPARLRTATLARLTATGTVVHPVPVERVLEDGGVRLGDGRTVRHDLLVVAAGAWTRALLADAGLPSGSLRTKEIRYQRCLLDAPGLPPFVDETTGLYGRVLDRDTFLLGLPSDRWDVDPDREPGPDFTDRLLEVARQRLTAPVAGGPAVHATDCFADPAGLRVRAVAPAVVTFTGGSGGAAKTVLAASRRAAYAVAALARNGTTSTVPAA